MGVKPTPVFLTKGDVMTLGIEGLCEQRHLVVPFKLYFNVIERAGQSVNWGRIAITGRKRASAEFGRSRSDPID